MPERLRERPLAVDGYVDRSQGHRRDPFHGRRPHRLQPHPAGAHRVGVPSPQRGSFGVAAVKLGLHQRRHLDAVDPQPVDFAVELGPGQIGAADPDPAEIALPEPGAAQIRSHELGARKVVGLGEGHHAPDPRTTRRHRSRPH
jgi:hypothetical protein